jgi:hypothetical protein
MVSQLTDRILTNTSTLIKVFIGSNYDIHSFEEGDLVMFSGKFAHRKDHINPMFVCIVIKICK